MSVPDKGVFRPTPLLTCGVGLFHGVLCGKDHTLALRLCLHGADWSSSFYVNCMKGFVQIVV